MLNFGEHSEIIKHLTGRGDAQAIVIREQTVLSRVMAAAGVNIDQVVNCPIARNKVRSYFYLSRQIDRRIEVWELERQWNPLG